jgi:glutathione S-transferase
MMKLYYAPGACSLATRISLHEAGIPAVFERVDLRAKLTQHGENYLPINPAGNVPLLVLDDGEKVTENVAILSLLAEKAPQLGAQGPLARTRLVEILSFLSTELHIAFKPFFHDAGEAERAMATEAVERRLDLISDAMTGPYVLGQNFSVADAYLFVMLRWAKGFNVAIPSKLADLYQLVAGRESVRRALQEEELVTPPATEAAAATPAPAIPA